MKKVVGYIFSIVGIILILLNLNFINYDVKILESIPKHLITIVGLALIVVSVIILKGDRITTESNDNTSKELPIYEGDSIVGFRRQQSVNNKNKKKRKI